MKQIQAKRFYVAYGMSNIDPGFAGRILLAKQVLANYGYTCYKNISLPAMKLPVENAKKTLRMVVRAGRKGV
jgi:hypothetical protein